MRTSLIGVIVSLSWAPELPAQDSVPPPPAPPAPVIVSSPVESIPVPLPARPPGKPSTPAPARAPQPRTTLEGMIPVLDSIPIWYYPTGKVGRDARVVFRATIGFEGRVEPESIRLVSTTDTAFVAAARLTLMGAFYRPATAGGERLRVVVQQAIKYDRNTRRLCELDPTTPGVPPKC